MKIEQMKFKNIINFLQQITSNDFISDLYQNLSERLDDELLKMSDDQLAEEISITLNFSYSSVISAYLEENYNVVLEAGEEVDEVKQQCFLDYYIYEVIQENSAFDNELVSQDDDLWYALKKCAQCIKNYAKEIQSKEKVKYPYRITFDNDETLDEAIKLLAEHGIHFATGEVKH